MVTGYTKFKDQVIRGVLADDGLLDDFLQARPCRPTTAPASTSASSSTPGCSLACAAPTGRVLDAGSTFSTRWCWTYRSCSGREILVIYTLATERRVAPSERVARLRRPPLPLAYQTATSSESVACISTLEHVGMAQSFTTRRCGPTRTATPRRRPAGAPPSFDECFAPGGRLLLTIPFGRREDHGWLQQFDPDGIGRLIAAFGGETRSETYYRYHPDGWQHVDAAACADARYFNIHAAPTIEPDGAAAARAVCCLELARPHDPADRASQPTADRRPSIRAADRRDQRPDQPESRRRRVGDPGPAGPLERPGEPAERTSCSRPAVTRPTSSAGPAQGQRVVAWPFPQPASRRSATMTRRWQRVQRQAGPLGFGVDAAHRLWWQTSRRSPRPPSAAQTDRDYGHAASDVVHFPYAVHFPTDLPFVYEPLGSPASAPAGLLHARRGRWRDTVYREGCERAAYRDRHPLHEA